VSFFLTNFCGQIRQTLAKDFKKNGNQKKKKKLLQVTLIFSGWALSNFIGLTLNTVLRRQRNKKGRAF
jgi:hypothetical protein